MNKDFELRPFGKSDLSLYSNIQTYDHTVTLTYRIEGYSKFALFNLSQVPRSHNLWQSTCFEGFLKIRNSTAYYEINLSPNGKWNCYYFDDYRKGMVESNDFKLLELSIMADGVKAILVLPEVRFSHFSINATTVGPMEYWAIKHSAEEPDFHDFENFIEI